MTGGGDYFGTHPPVSKKRKEHPAVPLKPKPGLNGPPANPSGEGPHNKKANTRSFHSDARCFTASSLRMTRAG